MYRLLKRLLMFRVGQKTARGFARGIGMRGVAPIIGIIGGFRHMRRHA